MTDDRSAPNRATSGGPGPVSAPELAAHLAARMCHDFISPASAIASGLDLLEDPSAAEMREDAMSLIGSSSRKLVDLLAFSRVAFGASASAESFDPQELEKLTRGVYAHVRPTLEWSAPATSLPKPAARALLNMAQIAASALPTGGVAKLAVRARPDRVVVTAEARDARARLRPEVARGLRGEALDGGLGGHWVQAYYLFALIADAGGQLDHTAEAGLVRLVAEVPAG